MENLVMTEIYNGDNLDKFRVMLYCMKKYGHVINICDIFDKKTVLDMMDIFAGMTIRMPDKKTLVDIVRAIIIFNHMNRVNNENTVSNLARQFNIDQKKVRKIYKITYRKFMQHDLAEPDQNIEKFRVLKVGGVEVGDVVMAEHEYKPDNEAGKHVMAVVRRFAAVVDSVLYPHDKLAKLRFLIMQSSMKLGKCDA